MSVITPSFLATSSIELEKKINSNRERDIYVGRWSKSPEILKVIIKICHSGSDIRNECYLARRAAGFHLNRDDSKPESIFQFAAEKSDLSLESFCSSHDARQKLMEKMDKTNILIPYGCLSDESDLAWCIVLPHVRMDVRELLKVRSRLEVGSALSIAKDVAIALGYCHVNRIIHLDVKPSNVVFDPEKQKSYLLDFSLSQVFPRVGFSSTQKFGGTPMYMSPEQIFNAGTLVDNRSDLYSLGIMLFHLLIGHPPFQSSLRLDGLRHSHLSVVPPALSTLDSNIPDIVSQLVAKLLQKQPENRYSSAYSLAADIEAILTLAASPITNPLKLNDIQTPMLIRPLKKIYGRADSTSAIVSTCLGTLQNHKEEQHSKLILIAGESGIGKSALVSSAASHFSDEKVIFCTGKFQQYERSPFGAVINALSEMVNAVVAMQRDEYVHICELFQDKTSEIELLVQICPFLKPLTKFSEERPGEILILDSQQYSARIQQAFREIFLVFYRDLRIPIIMFLDDLQWADDSSLSFMQNVLLDDFLHIVMIGAFREDEVCETHPLANTLAKLRENQDSVEIHKVILDPLQLPHAIEMIYDMIGDEVQNKKEFWKREVSMLATEILSHTGGNPFFMIQFLYGLADRFLIYFDLNEGNWSWDLKRIKQEPVSTYNVIKYMESTFQLLPNQTKQLIALLGKTAIPSSASFLAFAMNSYNHRNCASSPTIPCFDSINVLQSLQPVLEIGLLKMITPKTPDNGSDSSAADLLIWFTHDRVEEAAVHLDVVDQVLPSTIQLDIAGTIAHFLHLKNLDIIDSDSRLIKRADPQVSPDSIDADEALWAKATIPEPIPSTFVMIGHFSAQISLLENEYALATLASITALSARKALSILAYERAIRFCLQALAFEQKLFDIQGGGITFSTPVDNPTALSENPSFSHVRRHRIFALYSDLASVQATSLHFDAATQSLNMCKFLSCSTEEMVRTLLAWIKLEGLRQNYMEAIEKGLSAIALLGHVIDKDISVHDCFTFVESKILVPLRNSETSGTNLFQSLPYEEDLLGDLLDVILNTCKPQAYLVNKLGLSIILTAVMVSTAIERNHVRIGTPCGLARLAFDIASIFQMEQQGYQITTKIALPLWERIGKNSSYDHHMYFYAGFITCWGENLRQGSIWSDRAFNLALHNGDLAVCAYSSYCYLWYCQYEGLPLRSLVRICKERLPFVVKTGLQDMSDAMDSILYSALLMFKPNWSFALISDFNTFESRLSHEAKLAFTSFHVYVAFAYFALGRQKEARERMQQCTEQLLFLSAGSSQFHDQTWISSLVYGVELLNPQDLTNDEIRLFFSTITASLAKLKHWSEVSTTFWSSKYSLVQSVFSAVSYVLARKAPLFLSDSSAVSAAPDLLVVLQSFEECFAKAVKSNMCQIAGSCASFAIFFSASVGLQSPQRGWVANAIQSWNLYGAFAVVSFLQEYNNQVLRCNLDQLQNLGNSELFTSSSSNFQQDTSMHVASSEATQSSTIDWQIDVSAILKAENILSRFLVMEDLYKKFVDVIQKYSGSQRTILLMVRLEELDPISEHIEKPRDIHSISDMQFALNVVHEKDFVSFNAVSSKEQLENLMAMSVINMCLRKGANESLIVVDASTSTYSKDPYIAAHHPLSIAVIPMHVQGKLGGLIYLEHFDYKGVFSQQSTKLLKLLSSQLVISSKNAQLFKELKETNRALTQHQRASERFVPSSFLKILGKAQTTDVKLGDSKLVSLTVMFCDIRSFTKISEKLQAYEVFDFLNRVLSVVVPCVLNNHGSIDKFLGDGSLSIFEKAEDAINTAREIQLAIRKSNRLEQRQRDEGNIWPEVKIGIGIHTGAMIIGCLGTKERLDATVIGDTVNLASRVEGLTKFYDCNILATREVLLNANLSVDQGPVDSSTKDMFKFAPLVRALGPIEVEGKAQPYYIYQIFENPEILWKNGEEKIATMVEKCLANRNVFYEIRQKFMKSDPDAIALLKSQIADNEEDTILKVYLHLAVLHSREGSFPNRSVIDEEPALRISKDGTMSLPDTI